MSYNQEIFENIKKCHKCSLCNNQEPILDMKSTCDVIWVGLSAKKIKTRTEIPLSPTTNSGKIIKEIENHCLDVKTYKTNLVKCLPLSDKCKIRYPNNSEIDSCFSNLLIEINSLNPIIIFLLGEKVCSSVERNLNIKFNKWNNFNYYPKEYKKTFLVPIHHPSYIFVYKRKQIAEYSKKVSELIKQII